MANRREARYFRGNSALTIDIRDATPADRDVIVDFNCRLAEEAEGKTLDRKLLEQGVATLLNDASKGRYWLATQGETIAGQIMVTYEWSDWRNGMLWWIQSVYIPQAFRRQGVFSRLYRHVESLVSDDPEGCGLRLYVENSNTRAQEAYRNLAMFDSGYQVMQSFLIDEPGDGSNA